MIPNSKHACSPASRMSFSTSLVTFSTVSSIRAGWMRPSWIRRWTATRATSRRIESNPERMIVSGVSSTMMSIPVAFSSARMFRPSRPMIRPFISSLGRSTTDTAASATYSEAIRQMARPMICLARSSPVSCGDVLDALDHRGGVQLCLLLQRLHQLGLGLLRRQAGHHFQFPLRLGDHLGPVRFLLAHRLIPAAQLLFPAGQLAFAPVHDLQLPIQNLLPLIQSFLDVLDLLPSRPRLLLELRPGLQRLALDLELRLLAIRLDLPLRLADDPLRLLCRLLLQPMLSSLLDGAADDQADQRHADRHRCHNPDVHGIPSHLRVASRDRHRHCGPTCSHAAVRLGAGTKKPIHLFLFRYGSLCRFGMSPLNEFFDNGFPRSGAADRRRARCGARLPFTILPNPSPPGRTTRLRCRDASGATGVVPPERGGKRESGCETIGRTLSGTARGQGVDKTAGPLRTRQQGTPTIVPCAGPCLNLVHQVGIPQTL